MELNQEQNAVVNAPEDRVVVEAAAGSGKTACLIARFKREILNGTDPSKVVAITFTNNAADEMRERLAKYAEGAFIGTIHAYVNYLLLSANVNTYNYLDNEDFDALFQLLKEHPEAVKEVDYLSCDEAQDQTAEQYEVILSIINPKRWFIVADPRQEIFEWAGASIDEFFALKQRNDVKVYHLYRNYRCGSKILEYARGIIHLAGRDYEDNSISVSGKTGCVQDVVYDAKTLAKGIKTWTERNHQQWNDWFVLCRTNEEIDYICNVLSEYSIPNDTFKRKDLSRSALNEKLHDNTVKVLTIHAAKGLEATNVAVIGARFYNTEEKCISYVAATRAKELLIWTRPAYGKKKYTYNTSRMHTTNWE